MTSRVDNSFGQIILLGEIIGRQTTMKVSLEKPEPYIRRSETSGKILPVDTEAKLFTSRNVVNTN